MNMRHPHTRPECFGLRDRRRFGRYAILFLAVAMACLWMSITAGCNSTVTPDSVSARHASFDGQAQNSGILKLVPGGAVITPRARDRYNGLVVVYGGEFTPALRPDHGVTERIDGDYDITTEGLQKFIVMNQWKRMGRSPGKH